MPDLLWPGDERAGRLFAPETVLAALVRVEAAWLHALVTTGTVPAAARDDLLGLVTARDVEAVATGAESSGNPVIPMLALLRKRLGERNPVAAQWVHRGLTSQDVLDTALVLCARDAARRILTDLDRQVSTLVPLAERHRDDVMAGRTLTQHAVPITFGLKAAQWLQGVLDARDDLRRVTRRLPAQVGGAAGTLAAAAELVSRSGSSATVEQVVGNAAAALGLAVTPPWHTSRAPLTRYADALVTATDAWGRIANDVLLLVRPELGELAEDAVEGRGGSSTMPQKANPVLSVLIRRAALTAPALASQLHLAAAGAVDERPDGAWHAEWSTLATLSRRTVTAGSQTAELLDGLHVDTGKMATVVRQQTSALLAEQRSIAALFDSDGSSARRPDPDFDPSHYLGGTSTLIDTILDRARTDETSKRETL
jgi:3-carboxy-cis,cis-muconate cycloisomerase